MNPPTARSVARYWASPYMDMYIPVAYTTWAGLATLARTPSPDGQSWLLDPAPFHVANVLLHAASALVVYMILRRLLAARSDDPTTDWAACAGALLFAVHPLQVEPVAWVSGLRDVLGGFLALVAVWLYLIFASGGPRRKWAYVAGLAAFTLSILSKPSAMSLPLALASIDLLILRRNWRQAVMASGGWLAVATVAAILTRLAQPAAAIMPTPLWARPVVALDAIAFYAAQLVAPLRLGIDYGRSPQWLLSHAAVWWTWTVPVFAAIFLFQNRRRWPLAAASAAVFVAMLLPVLGLVPFEFQRHSTVADRYAYLAVVGAAIALAGAVRRWPSPITAAVVGCVLAAYGVQAYQQVWTWQDSRALYTHAVDVNPQSLAGNDWLGLDAAQHGDFDAALTYLHAALASHPNDPVTNYYLGGMLLYLNRPAEAVGPLRLGLNGRTDWYMYHQLAIALGRSGDLDGALAVCRQGLERWPDRAELHREAGDMLAAQHDWPAATAEFEAALRHNPNLNGLRERIQEVRRQAMTAPATSQSATGP